MKVSELINILNGMVLDADVGICYNGDNLLEDVSEIEKVVSVYDASITDGCKYEVIILHD